MINLTISKLFQEQSSRKVHKKSKNNSDSMSIRQHNKLTSPSRQWWLILMNVRWQWITWSLTFFYQTTLQERMLRPSLSFNYLKNPSILKKDKSVSIQLILIFISSNSRRHKKTITCNYGSCLTIILSKSNCSLNNHVTCYRNCWENIEIIQLLNLINH